ncbi:MAG: hypothetical protein NTY98_09950 [Verrucomicrobia bacterium]|nr:hypothetical protein [Verrucomicrobiota bacterium]
MALLPMLLVANLTLADIGVPVPADRLQQADVVAVGTIQEATESGGQPIFTATDVLKGNISPGKGYELDSPSGEVLRTIPDLIRRTGNKPFLLVAKFDQPSQKIWPVYGTGCVWPSHQGLRPEMRTPATLQECIAFAASVLKLPEQNRLEVVAPKSADMPHQPLPDKAATPPAPQPTAPVQKELAGVAPKASPTILNEPPMKASMPWPFYAAVSVAAGASLYFLLKKRR